MKRTFGVSVAMMLVVALPALMLTGLTTSGTLSASAQQRAQTAAAHRLFVKFLSSHAPMVRAPGNAATLASSNGDTELGSYNWSGFATLPPGSTLSGPGTTPVNSVTGSWTLPQVSCSTGPYRDEDVIIAQWVGLDGFNDETVEQLGTGTECYEGVEYYYDWYEMFPNNTVQEGPTSCINDNIDCPSPGDHITASVTSTLSDGTNDYTLSLTDANNPAQSFSATATCPATTCVNASAEWILERPAFYIPFGFQVVPQADYGQTAFSNAFAPIPSGFGGGGGGFGNFGQNNNGQNNNGNYGGGNGFTTYDIAMVDDTVGFFLSCPGQFGPPGQLLLVPTSASAPNPCPPASLNYGFFTDTWDGSF